MPFGAVFASLLLGLLGVFLPISALGAPNAPAALGRVALGVICLNSALGLLRRQTWARWGALTVAVVLLVLNDRIALPGGTVSRLALLFGAVLAVLLLVFPPTGRFAAGGQGGGTTLAFASVVGAVGLGLSLVWGAYAAPASARIEDPPIRIAGLSPRVTWSDFSSGIERAAAESKPVFVVFETNWCGYCRKMNDTTFKNPVVVDRLNDIVAIRVNAEDDKKIGRFSGRDLARRYGVSGFPSLLVLDPSGNVQARTSGYLETAAFLAWVDRAVRASAPGSDAS